MKRSFRGVVVGAAGSVVDKAASNAARKPARKAAGSASRTAFLRSRRWREHVHVGRAAPRRPLLAGVVFLGLLSAAPAAARCPNEAPADPACVPLASVAIPTVHAEALAPRGKTADGYLGGGFDLSLLSWSNNLDTFGPSQGALRLGASYLRGHDDRALVAYRVATLVSFEGNASRRFLIPTFGTAVGGLWETREKSKAVVEGSLGLFLVYTRHVVVDVQGGIFLPLSSSQALVGPKLQLSVGFALW